MSKDAVNKQDDKRQMSANGTPARQRKGKSAIQPADNHTARSYQTREQALTSSSTK